MAARILITRMSSLFFLLHLIMCSPHVTSSGFEAIQAECLAVPTSDFISSLKSTINAIGKVTSVVSSKRSAIFANFRLSTAISDCLDLLDLSADELHRTLSASQNPNDSSTDNLSNDLRTWLSGALENQDTCIEGIEGTTNIVKNLVERSLNHVTSLLHDLLSMVRQVPNAKSSDGGGSSSIGGGYSERKLKGNKKFPNWLKSNDRRLLQAGRVSADAVVAADGTGNFTRIMDAVSAAPDYSTRRFVIYIKKGVYREYVDINKKKWNLMMVGDGMDATVVSGNHNKVDGWTTYRSATFGVKGRGFIAMDMTIENTAGPEKHQAVAFRSDSDCSVLFRCAMRGYQDTLYAHSMRQFYKDCLITGTVDFIFGGGTVVFQNCQILARKGLPNQKNTITAQGRKYLSEPSGFSIQFSNISGEADLLSSVNSTYTYLGRPWKQYSRTVFMQSYMSNVIRPEGWLEWNGSFALDTLYYGEYMNSGPGAGFNSRVNWTGFHAINESSEANNFTVAQFILGNSWLPPTGVSYTAGLGSDLRS